MTADEILQLLIREMKAETIDPIQLLDMTMIVNYHYDAYWRRHIPDKTDAANFKKKCDKIDRILQVAYRQAVEVLRQP